MKIFNTKNFAAIGVAFCFIVIGLGAWTRLADAGLGCPDWPGCYGFVTFPTTPDEIAIAETLYPDSPVEIDKIIPEEPGGAHRNLDTQVLLVKNTIIQSMNNLKAIPIEDLVLKRKNKYLNITADI